MNHHRQPSTGSSRLFSWQGLVVLAIVSLIAFRWALPALFHHSQFLIALGGKAKWLAWVPTGLFLFLALMAYSMRRPADQTSTGGPATAMRLPLLLRPVSLTTIGDLPAQSLAKSLPTRARPRTPPMINPEAVKPKQWSTDVLRDMEWKRFELVAAAYYETKGYRAKMTDFGADDGVDVILYSDNRATPVAVVQCKAWTKEVDVKPIRELLGSMTYKRVKQGIFLTTSTYTIPAAKLAKRNSIEMIDGAGFLSRIGELSPELQHQLLDVATDGAWTTPTCPSCGVKMGKTKSQWKPRWKCVGPRKCKLTFPVREPESECS